MLSAFSLEKCLKETFRGFQEVDFRSTSFRREMASQSSPVTPEELARAQEILTRASQAGVKSRKESDYGYATMSDGCKRLRDQDLKDLALEEAWEPVTYTDPDPSLHQMRLEAGVSSSQVPVIPDKKKVSLPAGIVSLSDWGSTVCPLPKVSKLGKTYDELVKDKGYQSYLLWIQSHGKDRDGKFGEFAAYLAAISYAESVSAQHTSDENSSFPGSTERREKR